MHMANTVLAQAYLAEAKGQLEESAAKVEHCLAQLSESQLWWRPTPSQNSIGNLVLHLCGNVRQWIISGVGGAPDVRDRPREFAADIRLPKCELQRVLHACIAEAVAALSKADSDTLISSRRIQGFERTGLSAVLHSICHFQGHTQEIISLTRQQLGDEYRFHWTPSTPEQTSQRTA
jgi:hypothetical protein